MAGGDSIRMGDSSRGSGLGGDSGGEAGGDFFFLRLGGGGGMGGVAGAVTRLRVVERADFRTGSGSLEGGLVSSSPMID
jgi:hypothetical protein